MRSVLALNLIALANLAVAQEQYSIDPNSVSKSDRTYWCDQQTATCPFICTQLPGVTSTTTESNDCDADNLTYDCVCDNGVSPNATQYSQTLPFFICQTWGNQCVGNCNGNTTCQSACRQDHPCGAQAPYRGNATLSSLAAASASAARTATTSIPITGFGGASATGSSSSQKGAASVPYVPDATLSMAALFGSVFLGFAILL